jgi:hypothetical protein
MSETKKHVTVTVTVTKKMLREELSACESGIDDVKRFLPAKLSTDPIKNLPLAMRMCRAYKGWRAWWMFSATQDYLTDNFTTYIGEDPYVVAQELAAFADYYATQKGR